MNDPEQRLNEAGERWRDRQPPPYEVDGSLFAPPHRRRWFRFDPAVVGLTGAAAAIVAILVGVVAIGINSGSNDGASDSGAMAGAQRAQGNLETGQLVTATGTLDDATGELRLCPPVSARVSAQSSGAHPCPGGVRLLGNIRDHSLFTGAPVTVVGRWRDGAIEVTKGTDEPVPAQQRKKPPGCRATGAGDLDQLRALVRANPNAYSSAWRNDDGSVTVGAVGGLQDARAELGDNVCVVPAPYSYADLTKAQRSVAPNTPKLGIYDYGIEVVDNVAIVALHVPVVTDEVRALANRLGDAVRPIPWIRPVR